MAVRNDLGPFAAAGVRLFAAAALVALQGCGRVGYGTVSPGDGPLPSTGVAAPDTAPPLSPQPDMAPTPAPAPDTAVPDTAASPDARGADEPLSAAPPDLGVDLGVPDATPSTPPTADAADVAVSPSMGLVGYWKLDEGSGTRANDSSGLGHDGSFRGPAMWTAGGFAAATFPNPFSLSFNGRGRVLIPHTAALAFTREQSFTVATWARTPAMMEKGGFAGAVTKSRDALPNYGIWMEGSQWLCGGHDGTNFVNINSPSNATANTWYHVACVQDAATNTRILYVNGVEAARGNAVDANGTGELVIGATNGIDEPWNGVIDDVRIYQRALGPPEISRLTAGQ